MIRRLALILCCASLLVSSTAFAQGQPRGPRRGLDAAGAMRPGPPAGPGATLRRQVRRGVRAGRITPEERAAIQRDREQLRQEARRLRQGGGPVSPADRQRLREDARRLRDEVRRANRRP